MLPLLQTKIILQIPEKEQVTSEVVASAFPLNPGGNEPWYSTEFSKLI